MIHRFIFFAIITFLFSSCHQARDEKSLTKYIADPDHGLMKEKTINGVTMRVTYRPQDFLVKQELAANIKADAGTIKKLKDQYHKQLYFMVSLSVNHQEVLNSFAGDHGKFSDMVNQLAFTMNEHVNLITQQQDTLELVDYIYPRMYGMSGSTDMLFAFRNRDFSKAVWLKFVISAPSLQTGDVTFKFNTTDIIHTPSLKL